MDKVPYINLEINLTLFDSLFSFVSGSLVYKQCLRKYPLWFLFLTIPSVVIIILPLYTSHTERTIVILNSLHQCQVSKGMTLI